MESLEGAYNERWVLDDTSLESLRGNDVRAKLQLVDYAGTKIEENTRRRFIVFGEKEPFVQLVLEGTASHVSMTIFGEGGAAQARAFVKKLDAAAKKAKSK